MGDKKISSLWYPLIMDCPIINITYYDLLATSYMYNFVLHVELCAAASCPLHVEVVNSSSVAETRFLAPHSRTKPEFTELACFLTSVSQPLIIHFYTSTLLLLLLSVRTLQVIHVCASTTVLCSYHNAECIMCRFISSITWTVL